MRSGRGIGVRFAWLGVCLLLAGGCGSSRQTWEHAMAAYRPDVRGIRLAPRGEFPVKRNPGVLSVPAQDQPPMLRRDARPGPDPEVRVAGHASKKKSKARKLIVGDRIGVTIYTPQITQMETEIDTAGKVTLRWVGEVKIAGLTAEEAQAHIKRTYVDQKILQPSVIIDVIAAAQFFYIRGYCTKVGPFPAHMDLTLTRALAMA